MCGNGYFLSQDFFSFRSKSIFFRMKMGCIHCLSSPFVRDVDLSFTKVIHWIRFVCMKYNV